MSFCSYSSIFPFLFRCSASNRMVSNLFLSFSQMLASLLSSDFSSRTSEFSSFSSSIFCTSSLEVSGLEKLQYSLLVINSSWFSSRVSFTSAISFCCSSLFALLFKKIWIFCISWKSTIPIGIMIIKMVIPIHNLAIIGCILLLKK